jgi:predicted TIM-barrel fold metal-dependent hydrolase
MHYIDAHVHVWNQDLDKYPFAPGHDPASAKPATFFPEDIIAHGKGSGVDRIVLVQMSYYGSDNTYMVDVMKEYEGVFSGIAVVDEEADKPDEEMVRLAAQGVRGFRINPRGKPVETWLEGDGYERMFAAGSEHNLALCPLISPVALPALARRCEQFPQTPVIIDHLCLIGAGRPIDAAEIGQLCAMAQYPRVMVKASAFYALGEKKAPHDELGELIRQVRDAFGADRLMWASDCPYQVQGEHTYDPSVALIRERLDFLTDQEREQILRRTAEDFFFKG